METVLNVISVGILIGFIGLGLFAVFLIFNDIRGAKPKRPREQSGRLLDLQARCSSLESRVRALESSRGLQQTSVPNSSEIASIKRDIQQIKDVQDEIIRTVNQLIDKTNRR